MPTSTFMLLMQVLVYAFTLWLGLYLLARDFSKAHLRLAGLGLLSYALALGMAALAELAPLPVSTALANLHASLVYLPALFWSGGLLHLASEDYSATAWTRLWSLLVLPLGLFVLALNALAASVPDLLVAVVILVPLAIGFLFALRRAWGTLASRPNRLPITVTLIFGLATGLALFPLSALPRIWVILSIGVDMLLLGLSIAILDAFDEGETLRGDMLRSFQATFFTSLLFGGQVALVIYLGTGLSFAMLLLLLATLAASAAIVTLAGPLQSLLDRAALRPQVQQQRATLRAAAEAQIRLNRKLDLRSLEEEEFTRLTRRALSHFGDLARLASSPLTRLPLIEARLQTRDARDDTLQRAAELKTLLSESVQRLKPGSENDFGTTDEWRYYNALYFPYVVGLKPYRRRQALEDYDEAARQALDWFRMQVPERTLYNWQSAAARLIAIDLREQMAKE